MAVPTVSSVTPNTGSTAGGLNVAIGGTSFTGARQVTFGGTPAAFTVTSDTAISATSPAGVAGTVDVKVTNADGTSAAGAGDKFTYQAPPAPVVQSVTPNTGTTAGGTAVTIGGGNFSAPATVSFGASFGTNVVVDSSTSIRAKSPAAAAAGQVHVRVTCGGQTSATGPNDVFTYQAFSPGGSASPKAGGAVV